MVREDLMTSSSIPAGKRRLWRLARRQRRRRWRLLACQRALRPWLHLLMGVSITLLLFCTGYFLWNPCRFIKPPENFKTNVIKLVGSDSQHKGAAALPRGRRACRVFCAVDSLLRPEDPHYERLPVFRVAVFEPVLRETYYVYELRGFAHLFIVYAVRDGDVVPHVKFCYDQPH